MLEVPAENEMVRKKDGEKKDGEKKDGAQKDGEKKEGEKKPADSTSPDGVKKSKSATSVAKKKVETPRDKDSTA